LNDFQRDRYQGCASGAPQDASLSSFRKLAHGISLLAAADPLIARAGRGGVRTRAGCAGDIINWSTIDLDARFISAVACRLAR
jgi:hypothetical protein